MITRIVLFLLSLSILGWFSRAVVEPVANVAKTNVAISTVNGGNAEYVANRAYNETFNSGWFSIGALILLFVFFYDPIKNALAKSKDSA
jgi:hypothetical protein